MSPSRRRGEAGLSLVEVMTALLVIGLATSMVVIAFPQRPELIEETADAFAVQMAVAADAAIAGGQPVGVFLDADGYRFARRIGPDWTPISDDRALRPRAWPEGVEADMIRAGVVAGAGRMGDLSPQQLPLIPQIRFDPTGAASPATIELLADGETRRISIAADGGVTVVNEAADYASTRDG